MWFRLLCMWCWACLSMYTQASSHSVSVDYAYLYSESEKSIADIQLIDADQWRVVDGFGNHGFKSGEYWLRATFSNRQNQAHKFIFRFEYALHDEVDFYQVDLTSKAIKIKQQGDTRNQSDHDVMDKHAAIRVALNPLQQKTFYIRVASKNALVLSTDVLSELEHQRSVHYETIFSSLIYGVLLVMALYNFGLATRLKDKAYYSYVLYVLTFTAFVLAVSGDGYFYFWCDSPVFNQFFLPAISGFLIIPSMLFPYYLLNMKQHAPRLAKMYMGFMLLALAFVLSIPFVGVAKAVIFVNGLSSVLSIIILSVGIYLTYKKVPLAGLYTFSWLMLLIGLSVLSFSSLGLIDSNLFTRNAGFLGGVVEAIILSLALAQRITQERKDKMLAISEAMQSRKLFQELFDQAPLGIMRYDLSGHLVAINPALVKMLEFNDQQEALDQFHVLDSFVSDYGDVSRELMAKGRVLDKQLSVNTANGHVLHCSVSLHFHQEGDAQFIEGFLIDISERIESEHVREFMEQERLTSMEHLIIGVAHEVNTPLGVNITSVSHIKEILSEVDGEMQDNSLTRKKFAGFVDDAQQLLEIVTHNLNKMSNLVRRFKMVSMGKVEKVSVNLKHQIEQSLFSHHLIEEDIAIKVNCDNQVNIISYPIAWNIIIEQLIENSIVHGFSSEQAHKQITINVTKDPDGLWHFDYMDNGKGLDEAVAEKAFNPFVTTKRSSIDHAGLGLYRIYNLVQRVFKGEVSIIKGDGFHLAISFEAKEDEQSIQKRA